MAVCTKFLGPNITPQLLGPWNYTNNFMNLERGAEVEPEPLEIIKPQIKTLQAVKPKPKFR